MIDKTDIRYLAEDMVENLREMSDGESVSTYQLFAGYGYDEDEYDSDDLLFRFAKANHITLDMSAHDDIDEGLLYNLEFVARNKKLRLNAHGVAAQIRQDIYTDIRYSVKRCRRNWMKGNGFWEDATSVPSR